ncbi:HYC_CC_PP family protein [Negadavirga shengliensis]|uniref:Transmembrane protein n=1 Tax=Negadavirga shengliensis TaxID=1389218 RepID=A0ABV9T2V5_9BACT
MRRFIQISLLLLYFLFHAGLSYSFHFCEENLRKVNFYLEKHDCCSESSSDASDMPSDCCENVPQVEMPNSNQWGQHHDLNVPTNVLLAFVAGIASEFYFLPQLTEGGGHENNTDPPKILKNPIYIFNQVFLI